MERLPGDMPIERDRSVQAKTGSTAPTPPIEAGARAQSIEADADAAVFRSKTAVHLSRQRLESSKRMMDQYKHQKKD